MILVGYPFIGFDIIAGGFESQGNQLVSMQFLERASGANWDDGNDFYCLGHPFYVARGLAL